MKIRNANETPASTFESEVLAMWMSGSREGERKANAEAITRDARLEYTLADLAWQAELEFEFGTASSTARYTPAGRAMPGFIRYERARLALESHIHGGPRGR